MPSVIKVKGSEVSVTTASTVSDSVLVRLANVQTTSVVVTVANTGGTIGTFTMPSNSVTFLEKETTDTVAASAAVLCVPVSYKI